MGAAESTMLAGEHYAGWGSIAGSRKALRGSRGSTGGSQKALRGGRGAPRVVRRVLGAAGEHWEAAREH